MQLTQVLVVDDERDLAESCAYFLQRAGYAAKCVDSAAAALTELLSGEYALVISDVRMPRVSGMELLAEIKQRDPDVEVLLITGYPDLAMAVEAIKRGAFDYLAKPYAEKDLLERVSKAVAHRRMKEQNAELKERLRTGSTAGQLVHQSAAFGKVLEMLERAARTDASVLLLGESGTGKELLAHFLHAQSARASKQFVPVDCAAIPVELFESELFGHVKGSFTGAASDKLGLFALADGGTLFLDELGELPLPFQSKLLRAIQERCVRPVGGEQTRAIDVRIVAATNRNLQKEVDEGRFRADLFYRLDVVRVAVPPLRERSEDVPALIEHFVRRYGEPLGIAAVSLEAAAALRAYHWPGNVRQLKNVIERACALGQAGELRLADLPGELTQDTPSALVDPGEGTFQEMKARHIAAIESAYLEGLLRKHKGNVTHCSEEAGMARSAFQKLMQKYGIRSTSYREDA